VTGAQLQPGEQLGGMQVLPLLACAAVMEQFGPQLLVARTLPSALHVRLMHAASAGTEVQPGIVLHGVPWLLTPH
jgi:hypothetical protein